MIQVEYIESSGTQWVNTQYVPTMQTKVEMHCNITPYAQFDTPFGSRANASSQGFLIFARYSGANTAKYAIGSVADTLIGNTASNYNNDIVIELSANRATFGADSVSVSATGLTNGRPLYFFNLNHNNSIYSGNVCACKMKLYYCRIYENDTLVHEYVAALDENDVACLYDTVTDAYLYNAGTGVFTAGDPVQPAFTVAFDAAGGEGSMANQRIFVDTPTALTACTFTREDYIFSGWATEQGGPVVYADGEIVENLAESGETVTLYAVWSAAPLSIVLQYNSSDRDHLDKEIENVRTLYGVFREECEITDPVILLDGDPAMLQGVNYFTIKALGRSYYLTRCRVIRSNLLEIAGHVDVLSSFKDAIREQTAIVRRAESDQAYNLYLNDGSLRVYADPYILTEPFPSGFTSPSFILAVAGSAGT